jgi:hypothetical protein
VLSIGSGQILTNIILYYHCSLHVFRHYLCIPQESPDGPKYVLSWYTFICDSNSFIFQNSCFLALSIVRYSKKTLQNTTFRKLHLFPSSYEGEGKIYTLLGPLERANLNDWTIPRQYLTMDNVKKSSDSLCYTPLAETFRIYLHS